MSEDEPEETSGDEGSDEAETSEEAEPAPGAGDEARSEESSASEGANDDEPSAEEASGNGLSGQGAPPPRWAADEPTAVWDESLMADEGYSELAEDREANPREATGPATTKNVGGEDGRRVKVSPDATGGHAAQPEGETGGVSWVITIAIALGLAVAVFLLVRYLR